MFLVVEGVLIGLANSDRERKSRPVVCDRQNEPKLPRKSSSGLRELCFGRSVCFAYILFGGTCKKDFAQQKREFFILERAYPVNPNSPLPPRGLRSQYRREAWADSSDHS